jgi:hypothetical protein
MSKVASFTILAAALSLSACNRGNEDALSENQIGGNAAERAEAGDNRCASAATLDLVKRELFRRAAEIRGNNADDYARIAEYALLTLDGAAPTAPVADDAAADCRARANLRFPPGLKVAGGRTTLTGSIGYGVGAPPSGTVSISDGDSITIPLATLTQARAGTSAAPAPAPAPIETPTRPAPVDPIAPLPDSDAADAAAAPGNPSFDCQRARTRSEIAVCNDPALGALDRSMSLQYRNAVLNADSATDRLLRQTRDRFLGYRDQCRDNRCISNTYRGRMREIDDIMAGRWQGTSR